jgi:hypothetical protein
MTARMPLILFWAEVEEEDEKYIFLGLMKREEEEEESSVLSRLMKMGGRGGREGDFCFIGGNGEGADREE